MYTRNPTISMSSLYVSSHLVPAGLIEGGRLLPQPTEVRPIIQPHHNIQTHIPELVWPFVRYTTSTDTRTGEGSVWAFTRHTQLFFNPTWPSKKINDVDFISNGER